MLKTSRFQQVRQIWISIKIQNMDKINLWELKHEKQLVYPKLSPN